MTRGRRWAVDATHVFCGSDGWCHLTAIIDCWDRNIVGWRLSKTGVAKIAAATLEDALRSRKVDPAANDLTLRSDNGLVFGAKPFVKVVRRYGLDQEYITPYTPEQNRMIEQPDGEMDHGADVPGERGYSVGQRALRCRCAPAKQVVASEM